MKNLTQLPWSGKCSKAKNDNTLGRMHGGIRSMIDSTMTRQWLDNSPRTTRVWRYVAMLLMVLTLGVGEMWGAYYCPGSLTAWSQDNDRKMTQVGSTSTYYMVVSSKAKGDYQFRVTEGSWDQSHGWSQAIAGSSDFTLTSAGSNNNINIKLTATSTLTVWFNSTNNKIWVTSGGYATQTVYVIGSNSWTDSNVKAHAFTDAAAYYAWASDQTMTKTSTISRAGTTYKVYSYTFPKGYKGVIFRYESTQTGDLTWNASTPYYSTELSAWFATTADALAKYLAGANWTGASWSTTASKMTDNGDGSYSKDISISDASKEISLKICKYNTWTDAFGGDAKGTGHNLSVDFGKDGSGNLTFKVAHDGTTKITLTSEGKINVDAPYQVSYAAGTGATGTVSASDITTYGSTCTLSSSTFSKTGYTQDGWATSDGGDKSYDLGGTYTGGYVDVTLYPHWTANEYTTSNNIKESDGTTNRGTYKVSYDATSITYTTAPSKTGYTVEGLYYETSLSNKIVNSDRTLRASTSYTTSASKWNQTSAPTMYVKWTAKTYTTTNNIKDEDGSTSAGTYTATYDATSIAINTAPTKSGYHVEGYYISTTFTSANKVANASGALEASVSGFTDASRHWIKDANVNLYVHWEENAANYTLTFGVANSPANDGTLSVTAGGSAASSGSSYVASTSIACTATPGTHSRVKGWYSDNSCVSAIGGAGTGNTYNFTLSANTAVYVGFETATTSITLSGNSGTNTSVTATHGNALPSFSASTREGYTLNGYFTNSSGGTKIINANGTLVKNVSGYTTNDDTPKWDNKDRTMTLHAQWSQKMSTLTTSCHYDAGNPSYAVPTKSVSSIGISTTSNLSATAAGTGYTFVGWTLTHCVRTDSNGETSRSITVRSDGSGEAATAVANYEEDLSTPYIVTGGNKIVTTGTTWRTTADDYNKMFKASGHSTESVAYFTVPVTATNTGSSNANYKFKIYKTTATTAYYGLTASGQYWVLRENDNGVARTLSTSGANIELRADVTGDYLIKVDYSSDPTITVYFPLAVTWTAASVYSGNAATITATVNDIESGKSIKYDVYAGSTATGDVIATWSGTTTTTSHSRDLSVTPSFGASETSKQYTVKVTYDGSQTATYTSYVYRKWDIYVQNNCGWANGIYYYGFNNGTNAEWPGAECDVYSGTWYTVTLDGKYPKFVLCNGNESCAIEKTGDLTTSISTYDAGSFRNFAFASEKDDGCSQKEKTYNLNTVTLSDPTVTLTTYDVISTTQIYVKGTITNFGNDGTAASDMQEVGFKIGETKYTTTCTSGSTFERYITGLTANTSYTVKAYATNLHGTGESADSTKTTRATGSYTVKVRTGVSDPVPYIRAFVYSDEGCGGTGLTANADGNGVAMTLAITGTTYKWYTYSLSNVYQKFYINENASSTETWDQTAPLEETCYWYHHGAAKNDRFGTMRCPYTKPQLMIEENAGEEDFEYLEMSTSPTISKTVTLAAKSTYQFKIVYNAEWYGKASVNLSRASNSVSSVSAAVEDNMAITTDVAGDYTFTFTTPGTVTVTYPTAYTVTFGMGTGGATIGASATSAGGTISSGAYVAAGDDVTFTQTASTGYTFAGWYDASTGGSAVSGMGTSDNVLDDIAADATVYSRYTANTYTVTFDATTNGGTCGTASKSVTFDDEYGELPTATRASKAFKGWFTLSSGGTQVTEETIVSTADDHTIYAQFEDIYSVTIDYKCGDAKLRTSSSTRASATALAPEITAPEIMGYTFSGWTGSNATFANASSATTTVNATAATTITATYTAIPTVYFKNNLNWDKVYVTFDCDWTTGTKNVPKNNGKPYFEMEQLGTSDIFSCVIPDAYVTSEYAGWENTIAFDNHGFDASDNVGSLEGGFNAGEFLGRGDFDPSATMFIPYNGDSEERNGGTYYRTGCWMKYNSTDPGYKVYANTYVSGSGGSAVAGTPVLLQADIAGGFEFKAKVNFPSANYTYGFMLHKEYTKNSDAVWYTNTGTITAETDDLPWHFYNDGASENGTRCGLKTESVGDYEFTVSFGTGRPVVNVTYPVSTGDWRLVYKDRAAWSGDAHDADWFIASRVIKAEADAVDTVSFFVSKATGANATVELQKCTEIDPETAAETWEKQGSNLDLSSITSTGIYNFRIEQNGSKEASAAYLGGYVGNFYIRTDAAEGGWSNYKTSGANTMTYSEYAEDNYDYFTHYYMKFVNTGTNIKFCIANDYSPCLTEYCVSDNYTNEWIEAYGNVRFMWDHRTNKVSRAYISGSGIVADRFLVLEGDEKMFDQDGDTLTTAGGGKVSDLDDYEMNFTDDQNWIYEASVQATPGARIKLTAKYNGKIQYFYGAEGDRSEETTDLLLGGDEESENKYKIRVVYDFKTNRLIKAFIPEGNISEELTIEADLMIIREAQGEAQQINFTGSGKLADVKTVYGAMKFNKYTVNGEEKTGGHSETGASRYERDLFYISFPFDVKLSDAFGFGTYGKHWIIEYYDGKERAEKGFWADTKTFWKYVLPAQRSSFTLKANEGYILALDLEEMTKGSSVWANGVEDVYVYFPSADEVEDIEATNKLIEIDQTGYKCNIGPRFEGGDDRRNADSYWHMIGVPSFANYSSALKPTSSGSTIDWRSTSMPYLYEWDSSDNSLEITSSATFSFKAMHSYMVQYAGESIYWSAVNATPSGVVARQEDKPTSIEFRMELRQDDKKTDQTYIRLSDDELVTTGFDYNYDLSKELKKSKSNIYTLVTSIIDEASVVTKTAGNVLPMTEQTIVVPVGVKIVANDDYTFSIPEGTEGVGVTLIDNETGIRTSLSAVDYTVSLEAGTYDNRFVLEISPIYNTPTEIEGVESQKSKVESRKLLIDGLLYIVRDGKVYDARGARVE